MVRHSPQRSMVGTNGFTSLIQRIKHGCVVDKCPRMFVIISSVLGLLIYILSRVVMPTRATSLYDSMLLSRNMNYSKEPFPKILHQVWLNYSKGPVPTEWENGIQRTRDMNPDFEYKRWNAHDVQSLLEESYPWFLKTYHSYPYDVERADAARYFIVHKYGGMYMDMDEFTNIPINNLVKDKKLEKVDCMLPGGTPSGVTNYLFLCKKGSPFMAHMTSRLRHSKGWYVIPYATVMWSTGPRFMTSRYEDFFNQNAIYVLPNKEVFEYFGCLYGQTWFSWDGVILHVIVYPFIRLGVHWGYIVVIPVTLFLVLLMYFFCCRNRKCSRANSNNGMAKGV